MKSRCLRSEFDGLGKSKVTMRIAVAMLAYTLLGRYIILFLLARARDDEPSASRSAEVKEI